MWFIAFGFCEQKIALFACLYSLQPRNALWQFRETWVHTSLSRLRLKKTTNTPCWDVAFSLACSFSTTACFMPQLQDGNYHAMMLLRPEESGCRNDVKTCVRKAAAVLAEGGREDAKKDFRMTRVWQ